MKFSKISFALVLFLVLSSLLPRAVLADCNYPSYCNMTPRSASNPNDPRPGDQCVIEGVTDNPNDPKSPYPYHYGTTTEHCGPLGFTWWPNSPSTCVPRCGFMGQGFCCDPSTSKRPAPPPTGIQPPPCAHYNNGQCTSVNTQFGPIQTDITGLTKNIFSILLGLSGGVAILLIIAAGYQLMLSQGNPEKVKEARERLTAAIVGLLFIIFSVAILQLIGVTILQIPGFK